MNSQTQTSDFHHHGCCKPRVSWTAVIVGTLVGIGLSFIFHIFNIAIGLTIVNTTATGTTLAIGGLIGMIIGVIVSMFMAGFVAGFLGSYYCHPRNFGVIYGFATWSLILIFTVLFSMHISKYAMAYSNNVTNPIAVVVVDQPNAPAVSTVPPTAKTEPKVVVNQDKAMQTLTAAACVVFLLTFLGALASCFGGYYGNCCKDLCSRDRYSA